MLDGELVCCDAQGRPVFDALLFRRARPCYFAFDLLWQDGEDLRRLPLLERKRRLRRLVPRRSVPLRYVDHVVGRGLKLYERACAEDLEGIVAKRADGIYRVVEERPSWIKVKNPTYSQARGRAEQFSRRRAK